MKRVFFSLLFLAIILLSAGCGGVGGSGGGSGSSSGSGSGTIATFTPDHVFVVVLENHGFLQVANSPFMPYLNSLAAQHAQADNYFANTHPSIDNYFMLTVGKAEANNNDAFTGMVADDNIVRALTAAGKSWKVYAESIPAVGYTGGDQLPYVKHHNPFAYFSDVVSSSTQANNMVPFTQLAADMASNSLPAFAFIVPNINHDAHDCPHGGSVCADTDKLAAADAWLKTNIDPLLNSPVFSNGVLLITWDESVEVDIINGGGQVLTVLAGAHVKPAFKSNTFFHHQSTLRMVLELLKVPDLPNTAATAPSMAEFFQ